MNHRFVPVSVLSGLFGLFSAGPAAAEADLVLDDFLTPGLSRLGTPWEGFTDRVMGGLTEMASGWRSEDGESFLRLEGRVRTENNGGFLQMRITLDPKGGRLDARPWTGVRLVVRGRPGPYAVHLRTGQNWFPWSFFAAPFGVWESWTEVSLPFAGFRGAYGATGTPELRTLQSVALVAIGAAFDARLDVKDLRLYR